MKLRCLDLDSPHLQPDLASKAGAPIGKIDVGTM